MKPMLASPAGASIPFPMMLSPKLDGVRCLIIDGVAMSRSLKPIPNKHTQALFGRPELNGLDGELIAGPPTAKDVYTQTTSGVMSIEGTPDVTFWVFDDFSCSGEFEERFGVACRRVQLQCHCEDVAHHRIPSAEKLLEYEQKYLALGYEGVMLRRPDGPYKHGRSTAKEAFLLKVKRFVDAEAKIIGMTEAQHNTNEAIRNELGQLERSSHKAGKVGKCTLGALMVKDVKTGVEFEIGTGFTAAQRDALWKMGIGLNGKLVKYKSQPVGVKDKPRFPVFLGFRDEIDL